MADTAGAKEILDKVTAQGLAVRDTKTSGASKDEIAVEVHRRSTLHPISSSSNHAATPSPAPPLAHPPSQARVFCLIEPRPAHHTHQPTAISLHHLRVSPRVLNFISTDNPITSCQGTLG